MKNKLVIILAVLIVTSVTCSGQAVFGPTDVNAFANLNEQRNGLLSDIDNLQYKISIIPEASDTAVLISQIKNILSFQEIDKKRLRKLMEKSPLDNSVDSLQTMIDNDSLRIKGMQGELENLRLRNTTKQILNDTLDVKYSKLRKVENDINQIMIPKLSQQNFMFDSGVAFVILMCILLGTFFFVLRKDEKIRQTIFASDSGIQFIALFSIIIAIILFGLTGVLEGKELSALLGSVAGYILGKVKFSSDNQSTPNKP